MFGARRRAGRKVVISLIALRETFPLTAFFGQVALLPRLRPRSICVTYALYCVYTTSRKLAMAPKKTTTLNLRIDPVLKEAVRMAAQREHRSVANMIEQLIRRHCAEAGITIPEQSELFQNDDG